jgi:membrane protease YdiL (CAAX protease family)
MDQQNSTTFFIFSPVLILALTQACALLFGSFLGPQNYIPIILIYWAGLGFVLYRYGLDHVGKWLQKPQGHWVWIVIAVVVGLSSLPLFLQHYQILSNLSILIPTIIFFLINPWLEEFFWRGMLLDVTAKWPSWAGVLYSTLFFTVFHSAFAWYSPAARNVPFYLAVAFLGLTMAIIYKNTKSVRLTVLSHMMINVLNLSIPSLLDMIQF